MGLPVKWSIPNSTGLSLKRDYSDIHHFQTNPHFHSSILAFITAQRMNFNFVFSAFLILFDSFCFFPPSGARSRISRYWGGFRCGGGWFDGISPAPRSMGWRMMMNQQMLGRWGTEILRTPIYWEVKKRRFWLAMSSSVRGGFIEFREIGDLPRIYAYAKNSKQRGWGAFPTCFFQEMRVFFGSRIPLETPTVDS